MSLASTSLSTLTGVIERITFHSEESGYTVARLNTGNVKQLTTIVGLVLTDFVVGENLLC